MQRTPGADRMDRGAPAGHVAEERGADQPQARLVHQFRLPACAWTRLLQVRAQRAEAEEEPAPGFLQVEGHLLAGVHAAGDEHRHVIDPGFADGCQTFGKQPVRASHRLGKAGAIPYVVIVEGRGCVAVKATGQLQGLCRRSGNLGRNPVRPGWQLGRGRRKSGRHERHFPRVVPQERGVVRERCRIDHEGPPRPGPRHAAS